jgi:Flp pilus assembly protein TadD
MIAAVRSVFGQFVLSVLGVWSVWAQVFYRAPQPFLTVLLAGITLATTALALVLWLASAYRAIGRRARPRGLVELGYRGCGLAIVVLAVWGLFLFGNGKLDGSDPIPHATRIVEVAAGETDLGVTVPFTWATLHSWQTPGRQERLLLRWDERTRVWVGQPVVVLVRRGFFGLPWVSAIEPDVARQSRELLKVVPEAAQVWRDLARFYVRVGRLEDARQTASEYVTRFPDDPEFPVQIAGVLAARSRFADVVALLTPVASGHQHVGAYMYLGYALGMQGRRSDGLPYLERARELEPDNWWPHYALGWVQGAHGDAAGAVRSFERALRLRPGLPDAERELHRLRSIAARQRV